MKIYNTIHRCVEEFHPLDPGRVRIYTCGPTVYDYAHIGNFRSYVWEDLLRRSLKLAGFAVTQVMNITDIEDKILARMQAERLTLEQATEPYIQAFFEDLDTLRIERAERYPRATEHIPEMIALAERLRDRGHTYESQGSLYFRIDSFPAYGRLSHLDCRELRVGARVDCDEYEKDDARDFVLWKAHKEGEPFWPSPFGDGRPGWHLECSAMSIKYLGESFDLHTGGVDNIFPHHENEIAQSEAATGRPFVRYWMHACHLMVDGEKMAKSKGNFYTLRDLVGRGHDPRAIRMLLLSTHYRTPLNFTVAGLAQAAAEVRRLEDFSARIDAAAPPAGRDEEFERRVDRASVEFRESLEDDLNISGALGAVFRLVRDGHAALDRGELPEGTRAHLRAAVDRMDGVLAVVRGPAEELEPEIVELVGARTAARARRDFAESDRIRDRLLDLGVVVEDTPDGVRVKRKLR